MDRDVTAFRERFNDYKNGKPVSEIYDAGLPRYAEGTELPIEQMMPYILAVENPTKQGLVNGVWRPPTDSSKWDTHAIGGGLDIREENNPIVYNYLKSKGRLNNPYLTVSEEEMLRKQTFEKTTLPALRKMYGKYKDKISEKGYARLAGMKWQGHPYLMAITPDSITGKAFLNAIASGDRDLDSVFDAYYKYPANAKRYGARINADVNYLKNYSTPSNVEPKSELVQLLEQLDKEKFLPWSNYHSPDYSLSNPAPSTISSWNNPTSPAFNTSGLYARRTTNNINNVVQDILFNDKDVLDALMDNLSNDAFGGKRLGFKNGKLPGYGDGRTGSVNWPMWDNAQITSYTIPFIQDKAIKLTNAGRATGAVLSTNLLDSLADNAMRAGVPIRTAIGLATKESTLGNPTDDRSAWNLSSKIRKLFNGVYPGTVQHINNGTNLVDGIKLINYHKGNIDHEMFNGAQGKSIIQEALEFYKTHPDKYNPGLKGYQKAVDARGDEVMNSTEIKKWYKEWEAKQMKIMRPEPYKIETNILNTAAPKFGAWKDGKLPGYKDGTSSGLNMGERSLLTSGEIANLVQSMPHEQGLQNGPIEDAVAAYIGGKTISMINAYNNYRRLRNAKNTYRIYREANDNTKNAAGTGPAPRSWKIADADRYARTMLEGDTPLGFLYDIFVSPMSSLYTKMQRHPQIGPVMRLFE